MKNTRILTVIASVLVAWMGLGYAMAEEASSLALPIFSVGLSFDRSPCFPLKYNLLPSEKLVVDIAAGSDTSAAEGLSPLLSKAHLMVASLALMASSAIA